jgi:gp16 family phage-associated protein
MSTTKQVKTPEQVKADFLANGLTISEWARRNNYKPREVSLVLNGQNKGRYGKGHAIAVALGIKPSTQQAA